MYNNVANYTGGKKEERMRQNDDGREKTAIVRGGVYKSLTGLVCALFLFFFDDRAHVENDFIVTIIIIVTRPRAAAVRVLRSAVSSGHL